MDAKKTARNRLSAEIENTEREINNLKVKIKNAVAIGIGEHNQESIDDAISMLTSIKWKIQKDDRLRKLYEEG